MAQNDFHAFIEKESLATLKDGLNGVQLRKIESQVGRVNVIKALSFFITNFNNNFNAKGKLTDEQIIILSGDLYSVFQYESLEDAMLMFKYARQGKIGDGNDFKLDSQTIFHKWVPAYLELKAIERENQHNKSKGEMNGMTNFNWKKEDLNNFKVDENLVLPTKLGQRMKEKIQVEEQPQIILKDRKQYLTEMYFQVRKMTDEQLKNYLVKCDVNKTNDKDTIPFDEDIFKLVEEEIDRRNNQKL